MASTSMPAASSAALVTVFRSYATASRGASARVLLPSSHCSRSAVTGSRPVSITRSRSMPIAAAAATTNGCGPCTDSSVVPRRPAARGR